MKGVHFCSLSCVLPCILGNIYVAVTMWHGCCHSLSFTDEETEAEGGGAAAEAPCRAKPSDTGERLCLLSPWFSKWGPRQQQQHCLDLVRNGIPGPLQTYGVWAGLSTLCLKEPSWGF